MDLTEDPMLREDPLTRALPILTMCEFTKFGTGGEKENTQGICVLPNNIVHQKFYLFLWFWLIFLVAATVILLLYRLALFLLPSFRSFVSNKLWAGHVGFKSLSSRLLIMFTFTVVVDETQHFTELTVKQFIEKNVSYSDWIVMASFHSNLTVVNFQNFLDDLAYNWNAKNKIK